MADIGLRYAAFARIKEHEERQAIQYDKGRAVGMMISANVTVSRNSNKLYADDVVAEEDNSISGAEIDLGLDDLTLENEQLMTGIDKSGDSGSEMYEDTDMPAPYGGFGYVRVRSKTDQKTLKTKRSFISTWWYKVLARIENEQAQTKGQNMEWRTPSLRLSAQGVYIDDSDKLKFRTRKEFATFDEAKAFIDKFANIDNEE